MSPRERDPTDGTPDPRCRGCQTELAANALSCPVCRQLRFQAELESLAQEASSHRENSAPREEIVAWRQALDLLPPESRQYRVIAEKVGELSQEIERLPALEGQPRKARDRRWLGWGAAGGLAMVLWKAKAVLAFLLTKGKLLMVGLTKAGTLFSMLASVGVYWAAFGWQLALGLVLSIYVHEMGHVAALRRLGIPASAPMFIPGLGAMVRLRQQPVDAREDARVGLAGPIWGFVAALACYGIFLATKQPVFAAIARVGAWINLFNLIPIPPLDGGRGLRALSKWQRWVVTLTALGAWWRTGDGLLILLTILLAAATIFGKAAKEGDERAMVEFAFLLLALAVLSTLPVPLSPVTAGLP